MAINENTYAILIYIVGNIFIWTGSDSRWHYSAAFSPFIKCRRLLGQSCQMLCLGKASLELWKNST